MAVHDPLGGVARPVADEDGEAPEQSLLRVGQQVVAPGDRAPQRPLPFGQVARPAGQQVDRVLQPLEDPGRREDLHARRGELDRERQALETRGDRADRIGLVSGGLEVGSNEAGPVDEQRLGLQAAERRHRVLLLAGDPERLARRGQDPDPGRRADEGGDRPGGRRQELLQVVEDEQQAAAGEVRLYELGGRPVGLLGDPQYSCDRRRDERRVADRRELDEHPAVGEPVDDPFGDADREARLAGAARAGEGDDPRAGEEVRDRGDLGCAPDKCREDGW